MPGPRSVHFSLATVASGGLVGVLLCASNLYLGLKLGFSDSGNIAAVLLTLALVSAVTRRGRFSLFDNQLAQTIAVVMGAAGSSLVTAMAALELVQTGLSAWTLMLWLALLGSCGVWLGVQLQPLLIEREKLPFPTGIAAAELLTAVHSGRDDARPRVRAILLGGVPAAVLTWFRDGVPAVIPSQLSAPFRWFGQPAETWGMGLALTPALFGTGALIGLNGGLSVLLGACVAWGGLAPWLVQSGKVGGTDYFTVVAWLVWPGLAMILGASAASLTSLPGMLKSSLKSLRGSTTEPTPSSRASLWGLVGLLLVAGGLARVLFGATPASIVVALVLSVVLGLVCSRAAGQTDMAPIGALGQAALIVIAMINTATTTQLLALSSIVTIVLSQVVVSLWCLKSGADVGLEVAPQRWAQLGAAVGGALVAVPLFWLLVRANGLGTALLPAPGAVMFRTFTEALVKDRGQLPPAVIPVASVSFVVGAGLSLAPRRAWLPSPLALGTAFVVPASYAVTVALGAVVTTLAHRRFKSAEALSPSVATGAIAGESLLGIAIAGLRVAGLL